MSAEKRSTPRAHVLQYGGLAFLSGVFSAMPHWLALHGGDFLGRVAHRFVPLRRRVAEDNLRQALPSLGDAERRRIIARMYRHLGRSLVEFCRYPVMKPRFIASHVAIEGEEHLRAAADAGHGVFLVTSHLGNWELFGASLAARGFPVSFLVGPHRNKLAEELFNRYRALHGVEVIVTDGDLRGVFRALRRERIVVTAADQDAGPSGHFLDFFGRPASVAIGPYRIARRTGSPVVMGFTLRENGRHRGIVDPPLWPDPATEPAAEAADFAARYHRRLEELITSHPEMWFWVHRRWKTRPPAR